MITDKNLIKLDVSKLAKKLNVSTQSIYKWMNGKSFPSYKNLLKLQKATGMSLGQITKMLQK
jgi:transcriptional regulator with XRE-family HTH domain